MKACCCARRRELHERIARALEERFPELAAPSRKSWRIISAAGRTGAPAWIPRARRRQAVSRLGLSRRRSRISPRASKRPKRCRIRRSACAANSTFCSSSARRWSSYTACRVVEAEEAYRRAAEIGETLADGAAIYRGQMGPVAQRQSRTQDGAGPRAGERTGVAGAALRRRASAAGSLSLPVVDRDFPRRCRGRAAPMAGIGIELYDHGPPSPSRRRVRRPRSRRLRACLQCARAADVRRPGKAKRGFRRGIALAETLDHPNSLAHALYNPATGRQFGGDRDATAEAAQRAAALAEKFGLAAWRAGSLILVAWAHAVGASPRRRD